MDVLDRAERYLLHHGRLIDRLRFQALFRGGPREPVLHALHAYQNPDGGFGHALEPDLRGAGSQPESVEVALWILDELDAFGSPMVAAACDYLASVTTPDGGVPWVLPSVRETPRAPWWQTDDDPPGALVPTAPIAGLLHKHGVAHPWLAGATAFCWSRLADLKEPGTYEAMAALTFLTYVPDRERALAEFDRLRDVLLGTVTYDLDAPGHVHHPLDFAPRPSPLPLFPPGHPGHPPRRAARRAVPGRRLGPELDDVDAIGGARVGRLHHRPAPADAARVREAWRSVVGRAYVGAMYAERPPASGLTGRIACEWLRTSDTSASPALAWGALGSGSSVTPRAAGWWAGARGARRLCRPDLG
ncbi:hypothetical protein [Nonomuraea salmonea]|uniref:hypothetical protein n=1 Tax=Nonomuraea salmonea TaxID=46181 RepID=UPI002FE87937